MSSEIGQSGHDTSSTEVDQSDHHTATLGDKAIEQPWGKTSVEKLRERTIKVGREVKITRVNWGEGIFWTRQLCSGLLLVTGIW